MKLKVAFLYLHTIDLLWSFFYVWYDVVCVAFSIILSADRLQLILEHEVSIDLLIAPSPFSLQPVLHQNHIRGGYSEAWSLYFV